MPDEVPLPTHHKALTYTNPGEISIALTSVPTPRPGPGQVLVKITHSGVCSSDHGLLKGTLGFPPTLHNQVGGHEGVGTVVALTPPNPANTTIGSRVGIKWVSSICHTCPPCAAGRDALCTSVKISGYGGCPGTFQQYVLAPAEYVTPIPEGVASELAAPLLCGGVTVYAGLKKAGVGKGQTVVVMGAGGGLGHLAVQIARGMGLGVVGIDAGEKEEFVRSLGAEAFFDIRKYARDQAGSEQLARDVRAATPGGTGAASVIVCAGNNAAYAQAIGFLGFAGSVVCIGIPEGAPVPIGGASPGALIAQELRILGSAVGNRQDAIETLDLAAKGVIKTHVTVEPMSKLADVFERMERMELQGRVVIDMSRDE
ncbi:alcohol dehydrogenase [Cercophora scortea]|uniref:Alcohol dehydrogenase n=1 Tax=Cercophora scortea TaxID=314031 RepID=A0AAE0ILA2_9PEZI|nr:alcohol dehydrogenase [Cercophora scortea]